MFSSVGGWKGRCKQISLACVGSAHSVRTTLGLPQLKVACAFWVYTPQAAGCSAGEPSKADPAFCALLRSRLLRFLGTLQGPRFSWVCILCPSQVRTAQATRCLASALPQVDLITSCPGCSVSRVCHARTVSGVPCVSSGELISGCNPPGRCQLSGIPGRRG